MKVNCTEIIKFSGDIMGNISLAKSCAGAWYVYVNAKKWRQCHWPARKLIIEGSYKKVYRGKITIEVHE